MDGRGDDDLPKTVTVLKRGGRCTVFLIGTAHFSSESENDVRKVIHKTLPNIVLVELCNSRVGVLRLNEETLLEEAKNLDLAKVRDLIKQNGLNQGIMTALFLSMSAQLTKQLGMAPGGEFRAAYEEAQKIPYCQLRLGDRPVNITLKRAFSHLSLWQKLHLGWQVLTSNETITKEDVEKFKDKDLLESLLLELTGDYPELSQVFVAERDIYLTYMIQKAADASLAEVHHHEENSELESEDSASEPDPESDEVAVVAVVGMGHVPGIVKNWENILDIKPLLIIPPESKSWIFFRKAVKISGCLLLLFTIHKLYRWLLSPLLWNFYNYVMPK